MFHEASLVATIVVSLSLAFVFGIAAHRLKVSLLVGYLLAGIAVGPFTPGFIADQNLASQLADVGVILLMFGVGLHFSPKDLLSVRKIVVPGAVIQIVVSVLLGMGLSLLLGWSVGAGLVFGLALSVASTVVLMRALQNRRLFDTDRGRVTVGWLVVQDLLMVVALILLPPFATSLDGGAGASAQELDFGNLAVALGITFGKVAAFIAVMLVIGRRAIPLLLHYVAHTGSRELFRLAVLTIALSVAFGAAQLFNISFALGAFFAGMILSESALSQRAAEESLPFRDAFAALFFISVGMLFDPNIILSNPLALVGALLIVVVGNAGVAYLIVRALGHSIEVALTVAAGLAQIGEFSLILANIGLSLHLLPERARDVVLGVSIISILLNPLAFVLKDWIRARLQQKTDGTPPEQDKVDPELPVTTLRQHAVLIGCGRVGRIVCDRLLAAGTPLFVIEETAEIVDKLRERSVEAISGNAADEVLLHAANMEAARILFVAIPDAFEAGQIVQQARLANKDVEIIARAHFDAEVEHLTRLGADTVIMGEEEIAHAMLGRAFEVLAEPTPRPTLRPV
ncbi:MAG TPA: YbaL family putative K(+) efflux transporter [Stellaceae bacterium]|jgi:CPA2 family monovalent cation:H+ antiporter-2|nr:YbaL family putative K(+) efflux transporter [Stellaceae bacterium]